MMHDSVYPEFVEVDPSGRYGRYNEVLGKGASKTVAFDEYEGMEVAWNQVKLYDFLQSPDDLERLYCEIHLLKTLKHKNIMKFYASWVDISKRNINFVTEMFTSGTLRQYRQMHKRVHIRAVKHWCRQILIGLLYLHSNDPPIIHRDLKCDNIFINGNQGEVKIGDLGLAAILRKSHAVHCVGTPEFMAPEVYEEEYNELVDIYSFGMCVLEMVTFEYPYSECTHPAQIYKKVISGAKPDALYRVKDPEVREFIKKCLAKASQRPSSRELLMDPFLQNDCIDMRPISRQPSYSSHINNECLISNGSSSDLQHESEMENGWENDSDNFEKHGIDLFSSDEDKDEDEPMKNMDITIKGRKGDDGGIFIRLRIGDTEGRARNIYFPFDIDADTALGVAAEMVDELDITNHEVTRIAEMIDGEVLSLVPKWESQLDLQHSSNLSNEYFCEQANDEAETFQKENESENISNYEKKTPQDTKWLKLIYQVKVKEFRKRVLGRRRTMNFSLDLDSEKLVCDEVKSSKFVKQMKSFHLGTRFSFRRPEVDREEDRSLMNNDHIALANIFEEKGYIAGDSFPNSLPRARSLCI